MTITRPAWLALVEEPAQEPELPIVDAHHHLWDYPGDAYGVAEYLADVASGHNILASVFVECRAFYRRDGSEALRPVGESAEVDRLAAIEAAKPKPRTAVAAGIVGHADLTLGDEVVPVLEAHVAASLQRFRGIRHISSWDASPEMHIPPPRAPRGQMLDPRFRKGFSHLARYGLVFDAWQLHPQLPELVSLARAFPDTSIVVNHVGGPLGIGSYALHRAEVIADWRRGLVELAECPNVTTKLGGLGMPRVGLGCVERSRPPTSEELAQMSAPYILPCIEIFGASRCMFESNFPVDKQSFSYGIVWNAFKHLTRGFQAAERAALFHDTAARVYHLPLE